MNKRRIVFILGSLVIGAWGLVLAVFMSRPLVNNASVLPTLAVLPTTSAIQANPPAVTIVAAAAIEVESAVVPNQVVIQFAPETGNDDQTAYLESVGAEIVERIPALNTVVITTPNTLDVLPAAPFIVVSEPDYYVSALAAVDVPTSDTYYSQQWGLEVIGAPQVWPVLPPDAPPFTVAVVDSGICADHPDLAGRIGDGYDFVENDTTPQDVAGHGCAVAGVIAANIDNGLGIAGVAPNTQIMPVRVLDAQGIGTYSDVAAGMVYAVDQGAAIINLSLGGPNPSSLLANAVNYATAHDVLVIAAAGNTGTEGVLYPAAYESVIAVGAVDADLQRSSFSTWGPEIDLLAPGRDIMTTRVDGGYDQFSGTSLAAPHVTGVAALELARGNSLTLDGGLVTLGDVEIVQAPTPLPGNIPPQYQALYDKAVERGQVRVLVGLNASYQPKGQLSETQAQAQQASIDQTRQGVVNGLSLFNTTVVARSDTWQIPALALQLDAGALEALINSPDVAHISEDVALPMSLVSSVPYIDADDAHSMGYTGSGQAVAILDTGIEASHSFLSGRVVEEACYSSNFVAFGITSLCPGGETFQTGSGAAAPTLCNGVMGCPHGTHVAGIAAGDGVNPGVAPSASIIAIQVFSRFTDSSFCDPGPTPCLLSYASDQVGALLYLDYLRPTYNIAAVNLSLGGGAYTSACDGANTVYKDAIDTLRSFDIATVVAAGNGGEFVNGIASPACISTAVSVGATDNSNNILPFSQYAPILDLLAPGSSIYSSILGDSFGWISGTSQAAPHVAGTWALLKSAVPDASVDDVLAALQTGGVPLLDDRNGVTTSRIDVDGALALLLPTELELVVNSSDDVDDLTCDETHCSLREAINAANATTGIRELISFNIAGGAPFTITPGVGDPLPIIIDPVMIDGTTQTGYAGVPIIEIDGSTVGATLDLTYIGLNVTAGDSIIRGLVINNFAFAGINLSLDGNNIVTGNYIGTEPDGTTAAPNRDGIRVCSSSNNRVGGSSAADRNVIAGNSDDGINLCQVPLFAISTQNVIRGNYIGVDATGSTALGNGDDGIKIVDSTYTTVGGANTEARNIISGNTGNGVRITGAATQFNLVQGNYIGTNVSGASTLGNGAYGVAIEDAAANNTVGSDAVSAAISRLELTYGNRIAGNGAGGILAVGTGTSNDFFYNELYDNTGLGIDLGGDGVTENDSNDVDSGPNDLLNFPLLTNAVGDSNSLTVSWSFNGTVDSDFWVDFYVSSACDASGNGEGETYLGSDFLTTNNVGNFSDMTVLDTPMLSPGDVITATITDSLFNVSEFSDCQTVTIDPDTLVVNSTNDIRDGDCGLHCSLADAITVANGLSGQQTIVFDILGTAPFVIQPTAELPTADNTIIDATTQFGYAGSPLIVLDGVKLINGDGLTLQSNSTIRGFAIYNFPDNGINLLGNFNTVEANTIGTDETGTIARPNGEHGVDAAGNNNLIGGTTAAARNVISGNNRNGVYIGGHATNSHTNTVQGNYIGTNAAGTAALPNGIQGIFVRHSDNIIGGTTGTTPGGPCTGACNLISGNTQNGIRITDQTANPGIEADSNTIQGNFIGTNLAGTAAIPNGESGIHLDVDTKFNLIGGGAAGAGNLIAGNTLYGVEIDGDSETRSNTVQGNTIGTNAAGTAALANTLSGVYITSASTLNTVSDNLISGNGDDGVTITGNNVNNNMVQGNTIGTNVAGTAALGNSGHGINITSFANTNQIGGTGAGEGNLISGNSQTGIRVDNSDQITIEANTIGTNAAGTAAVANASHGIEIRSGADDNQIGGSTSAARNLVSGNGGNGIHIQSSNTNAVTGNFIGTNIAGTAAQGNSGHGISITSNANTNQIGGIGDGEDNLISGNSQAGISVNNSDQSTIEGNYIGTNAAITAAVANGSHGIELRNGADNNQIGGSALAARNFVSGNIGSGIYLDQANNSTIRANIIGAGSDYYTDQIPNGQHGIHLVNSSNNEIGATDVAGLNLITFNIGDGIRIESGTGNGIYTNPIVDNGGLGINLGTDGVTANDSGDGDTGPNNRQNFPVITGVDLTLAEISVDATLNSAANTTYRVEFFWSDSCDPSGYGEGASGLSFPDVTTDVTGDASFTVVNSVVSVPDGSFITATATDPGGNTSEFSACVEAILYVAMPSSFAASVLSEVDIELTWTDESIDETHWLIERSLENADNWTQIVSIPTGDEAGTGAAVSYHDTDFLCSQSYDYRLRAFDQPDDYYSHYTSVVNASPTCPALNLPGAFTATVASHEQIDLSWTDSNTTETSYVIEHSTDSGLNWATLVVLPPDTTSYAHMGLTCVTTHDYRMRTVRDHEGPFSAYTAVESAMTDPCPPPVAPTSPLATALSGNQIQFSWTEGAAGETTTFHVERSSDGGATFNQIAVVPFNITSIVDEGLSCGQTYDYRVRSFRVDDGLFSAYSTVANDTTSACPTPVEHTVGLYRDGIWQFWDVNQNAQPAITFSFGPAQSDWLPVVGDWDGDDTDGIGLYKDGIWILRNTSDGGPVDMTITFGRREPGWLPVVGDWNGDGTDGIGLYKDGLFQLRQTASSGVSQINFSFGPGEPGWQPVAGDWNGSGNDTVGLFKDGLWLLSNALPARSDIAPFSFGPSQPDWLPLAGDWDSNGTTTIGVYKDRLWQLRNSNNSGSPDIGYSFPSSQVNWRPLASYRGGMGGLMILAQEVVPTAQPTATAMLESTVEATPEPTMTSTPEPTSESTSESTAEVTPEPTAEATLAATATVVAPTDEPTAEATAESTAESTIEPTATPTAEPPTATATATVEPPTATPTATAEPPTATVTPTVELPTATPTIIAETSETTEEPPAA